MSDDAKKKSSARFATMNHFVDVHLSKCKSSETAVYLAIWRYVRDGYSEIGHKQMAEITGYSERQVKRSVKSLVAMGAITIVRRGNNLMKKPNLYSIPIQNLHSTKVVASVTLQTIEESDADVTL